MNVFSSRMKNSQIEKLVEENDELKNTLHAVLQKHQSLVEIENKLSDTQSNFNELLKEIETGKSKLQEVTEHVEAKSAVVKDLEERKTSLEESIAILQTKVFETQEAEQTIAIKQNEIQVLTEQHDSLKTSFNRLHDDYITVQKNLEELKEQESKILKLVDKYGGDSDDSILKLTETSQELIEKIEQLKVEESKRNGIIKSLDEKILLNEEIKSNLESSLAGIVGQLSEKDRLFADFAGRRDSMVEELNRMQKEFNEFDSKYNFEKESLQKLEKEIDECSNKKQELTEELGKFENIKNELQDKILILKKEEERLTDELVNKHTLFDEREKHKFEFEENYLRIEKDFSGIMVKFTDEFEEAKSRLTTIRQEILEKEKELNAKEKTLLEKATVLAEYGGLAKVLLRERAAAEQILGNLKEEHNELNSEILSLRDEANKQKTIVQQLRMETQSILMKKEAIEKEVRQLMMATNEDYAVRAEEKQKLALEIADNNQLIENLKENIVNLKDELRALKNEAGSVKAQKEEYTSKISELIAMEKSLRFKISEHEKKLNGNEQ